MQVVITPKALNQHKQLPNREQQKVRKKILILEQKPFEGKRLVGSLAGVRSLRAWPYRILYSIDEKEEKPYIVTIGHRQGVYK